MITDVDMATKTSGIFGAGDGRKTPIRQIVTAASDGAIAAYSASCYIAKL
jgi:thioredoxin reductase (NADPH)